MRQANGWSEKCPKVNVEGTRIQQLPKHLKTEKVDEKVAEKVEEKDEDQGGFLDVHS